MLRLLTEGVETVLQLARFSLQPVFDEKDKRLQFCIAFLWSMWVVPVAFLLLYELAITRIIAFFLDK